MLQVYPKPHGEEGDSIFEGLKALTKKDISITLSQEEAALFKSAYQEEEKAKETQFVLGGDQ